MKRIIISVCFCALSVAFPCIAGAQESTPSNTKYFNARVLEITKQETVTLADGSRVEQQDLKLRGLDGDYEGQDFDYKGIGSFDAIQKNIYKAGDRVVVETSFNSEGKAMLFVADFVRTGPLLFLAIAFCLALLIVGRFKGVRALISLAFTIAVIMYYIIPQIADGADPLVVTVLGSFIILLAIIYVTEGFKTHSHLALSSIFLSLLLTVAISWLFVTLARLTGLADEEAGFLVSYGANVLNFQGLLLAGIIIGSLGVLDDVAIAQIAAVEELHKADPHMDRKELFNSA